MSGPASVRRERWRRRLADAWARRRTTRGERSLTWRLATPAVFAGAGVLAVTSAISADGIDLRAERYGDLESLARQQTRQVQSLQQRASELRTEVEELTAGVEDSRLDELEEQIDLLRGPAGLEAVTGSGVTVTLDDAPSSARDLIDGTTVTLDDLVIHQQDIQAVVNALWEGGAEAMTIQGQRIVSTTGIKCVGNVVILHGIQYAPPYEISAIGDTETLLGSLSTNPYITTFREYVDRYQLGYSVAVEGSLDMAAYDGSTEMSYARPVGSRPVVLDEDL
ncbi:DUF881 domain-containing protein [Nocardioides massiliensis]|uniref:Uncharacterized protein YlxW (UPF0749 family) n=1 Tax=Nocardioides massiliensis TaxID=1325935 RepID=A0ABT9NLJ4_9ACTN|nr:DUF881 domain-containing protein [Nocardioides massiliensis]MDP9821289.1 uncharacterized protein YlxW (UPF0749 family) [Nocardioides massiliensis]